MEHASRESGDAGSPVASPAAPAPARRETATAALLAALTPPGTAENVWDGVEYSNDARKPEHHNLKFRIPSDSTVPSSIDGQEFELWPYHCDTCGFHFDVQCRTKKTFKLWWKHGQDQDNQFNLLLGVPLTISALVALAFAWLEAAPMLLSVYWPLSSVLALLLALQTSAWTRFFLNMPRTFLESYRQWQPQSDEWFVARLVDGLARAQAEAMAREEVKSQQQTAEKTQPDAAEALITASKND